MTAAAHDSLKVPRSRLEVNFLRVLQEAHQVASGIKTKDWTFKKQVEWLEEKLPEMEKSPCAPCSDTVTVYRRRLCLLRTVLNTEDDCNTSIGCEDTIANGCASDCRIDAMAGSAVSDLDTSLLTQQIHHRTQAHVAARLRKQLLTGSTDTHVLSEDASTDGVDERLMADERRRDHLVDDMLALTRQWKDQSRTAGNIIKKDIETLESSSGAADTNQARLKTEADRLSEFNKRACNCWIWFMLLLVCCAFISMVLFIKLFPKPRSI